MCVSKRIRADVGRGRLYKELETKEITRIYLGESPISVKNSKRYVNQQEAVMSLSICPTP